MNRRIEMNVKSICSAYDFSITGASYIGNPRSNTVLYVSKKVEHLLINLKDVINCLVFVEKTICVPDEFHKVHCIMEVENPQGEYAEVMEQFGDEIFEIDKEREYQFDPKGFYIGENVTIGRNSYIEPGCLIGHDVIIGDNARIMAGTTIKHAIIGDDFVVNENAVIGSDSFTMAEDKQGNNIRIVSMGKVIIGNNVEIGANNNIARGSNSDTIIDNNVKLDALVHIGHDVHIEANTEITAGVIVAGFVEIGEDVFIGINSSLKNRVKLDKNCYIGMGANVIRNVDARQVVAGNPAKRIKEL